MSQPIDLTLSALRDGYRRGRMTPTDVVMQIWKRANAEPERHAWITRLPLDQLLARAERLARETLTHDTVERLPLFGIPFAIKDNIDLAGVPTTAGCPEFAYTPSRSATVVEKLIAAGAIPVGKTNLDQFATGLVGARSPYGACRNSFDPRYVSGGSSSGSAVAVATGLASFALGTDTAGSGRVPAAFNNLIGLKPSNGRLSTRGVVPACRSVDCVSIFALTAEDARDVLGVAQGFDSEDVFSRDVGNRGLSGRRFGVPRRDQLRFFGDTEYQRLFTAAVHNVEAIGGVCVDIDFEPFLETARLLYEGPWLAERYAAVGAFIDARPGAAHPVTRQIIEAGREPSAATAFTGMYRLKELQRRTEPVWSQVDVIMTPTAGTIYALDAVNADPLRLNANLGFYTNFMNLLDLSGVAVPAGFRLDGLPFGVTLVGPCGAERALLELASVLQRRAVSTLGALGLPLEPPAAAPPSTLYPGYTALAVCGAHMLGLALNHQLTDRGAYPLGSDKTASCYQLFALPGGPPARPGLLRVSQGGAAIDLEVWAMPTEKLGSLMADIPAPLGLSQIELASGDRVTGFVCESHAVREATDITRFGGWRRYLEESSG